MGLFGGFGLMSDISLGGFMEKNKNFGGMKDG